MRRIFWFGLLGCCFFVSLFINYWLNYEIKMPPVAEINQTDIIFARTMKNLEDIDRMLNEIMAEFPRRLKPDKVKKIK